MTATYIPTSQIANDPSGILWLEKREHQVGQTTLADIQDALDEYTRNFNSGNISKAEILTLHRAYPDSPTYKQAAVGIQKMDMVDPLVIGGPASIEMIDREGHLITTNALNKAFIKFMDNQRTRNVMVLHSDVQVGWALPAYISRGGQIFKSGVGEKGLFFICELRDDTSIAKKVADQINQGMLKSYSIAGSATKVQNMMKGQTPYMQVDEMELAEVTICEKGVNQGANFELLKAELPQTGKVDKDQCGYRDATAPEMKLGINCGHCKYFNSETRTCDVVVGDIMPGDYCRLFEAGEEDKPQIQVHRKIVIMRSDNTGRINFKDSFLNWMEKDHDPLKGKSFTTLNNIAGREAEHHRLLEEYGFPSEPILETMRYIPVVETETDDDGKPINIIPPWVVNEAGQDLGDKLDNDEVVTFNKSIEIINEILQKARTQSKLERDAKRKGYKPATSGPRGTRVKPPRPFMQPKVEPTKVDPSKVDPTTDEKDKKPIKEAIDKASGKANQKARQKQGGQGWHKNPPGARQFDPHWTPSTADMESRGTSDEIAHKRATPIGDPTQIKKPSVDKANGNPPVPRKTPEIRPPTSGQNIPTSGTDTGASTKGPSVWDSMKRQFGSTAGAAASGLGQAAGATRDVVGRGAGAVATGGRQAIERGREGLSTGAQRMGEIFRAGKKRVGETGEAIGRGSETAKGKIAEGGRAVGRQVAAGARGAQEFGGGLREGFGSYDPSTAKFDEIRSGGGKRDARGGLRRTAEGRKGQFAGKRSGARRVGQLFGATGRSAGEMAGEGARGVTQEAGRFGRGVARGATPGQAGRDWREREQGDDVGIDRQRSLSERAGQWLGGQGRERTADVLDTTGQTARGVKRGLVGKRGQEEYDRGDASAGEKFGRWMGEAARGAGRDIPKIGSGSRRDRQMLRDEGVGKGTNFQPSAHRGASSSEKHEMATGLADKVNARQNMSPKEWMELIHHMGQTKYGSRFLHISDIDMNHKDWNKPISFGDMRQHLDRMNVSHGTHGDGGRRGFDNIKNKLEDVVSGYDTGGLKLNPIPESEASEPNWKQRKPLEPRRQRRGRQRRPQPVKPRDSSDYYEGSFPVMNSTDYQSKNSVTDTFKRAFNMPASKGT